MHANSVRGFGPNLGVSDPTTILRLHRLANENGLDVDGLSSSLAFALECAENGILSMEQPGGVRLEWGNGESLLRLAEQIVRREGLGAVLAEGAFRAAEQIGNGSQAFAMTTKKVGINEQGIRSHRAWALGIMTSDRGGGHLGGAPQIENRQISAEEGLRLFGNPQAGIPAVYEGKGRIAAWTEGVKAAVDSLGLCYFAYGWYDLNIASLDELAELQSLASGRKISGAELHWHGLRVHALERVLNHRLGGFDRSGDSVPRRFFELPNDGGPYEGAHLDQTEVDRQLDEYYLSLGWDAVTGLPGEDCIRSYRLEQFLS
jgi:aldehyde:ferredoxin oxidoreductase